MYGVFQEFRMGSDYLSEGDMGRDDNGLGL